MKDSRQSIRGNFDKLSEAMKSNGYYYYYYEYFRTSPIYTSKTMICFTLPSFSNNNRRTNRHLRFPSKTTQILSTLLQSGGPPSLDTQRLDDIIDSVKTRRYANRDILNEAGARKGETNIETLPSTFHFLKKRTGRCID